MPERTTALAAAGLSAFSKRTAQIRQEDQAQANFDRQQDFAEGKATANQEALAAKLQRESESADVNLKLQQAKLSREQRKLQEEEKVSMLKNQSIEAQKAINNIDQFDAFMSKFDPGTPIDNSDPEVQQMMIDLVGSLNKNGVGVAIDGASVIPFEMGPDGNPVFINPVMMAEERQKHFNRIQGNKEQLRILDPSGANNVFSTRKEPGGSTLFFQDGTSKFVANKNLEAGFVVDKDPDGIDRFFNIIKDESGQATRIEEVDPVELQERIERLGNPDNIESLRNVFPKSIRPESGANVEERRRAGDPEALKPFFRRFNNQNLEQLDRAIREGI